MDVSASTWREGEEPYDVRSDIEDKLVVSGFEVLPVDSGSANTIRIVYNEEKGRGYTRSFSGIPDIGGEIVDYGTEITCDITVVKGRQVVFEKTIEASTPYRTSSDLYDAAIERLKSKVWFKYLGEFVAAAYGQADELSVVVSALLEDADRSTRSDAAYILMDLKDPRAVEPLIQALKDEYSDVRSWAALALGYIPNERSVEPLIEVLGDEDEGVRRWAAWSLGQIGDERAVVHLIENLDDEENLAQWAAMEALGLIGGKQPVEALIAMLSSSDDYDRKEAAEALGETGDSRAVPALTLALQDESLKVRAAAEEALAKITGS